VKLHITNTIATIRKSTQKSKPNVEKIVGSDKYVCEKRTSNTLTYDECVCTESSRESFFPEVTE